VALTRLILFAHGSADPQWRAPFESLLDELARTRGESMVRLAYLEFAPPTLSDVAAEARRDGVGRLRILPLFMAGGAHLRRDLPDQVDRIRERYPELVVELLPPVGDDPRLRAMIRDIALESC
jgi:sirohydrochlorin cobaltochelatase